MPFCHKDYFEKEQTQEKFWKQKLSYCFEREIYICKKISICKDISISIEKEDSKSLETLAWEKARAQVSITATPLFTVLPW